MPFSSEAGAAHDMAVKAAEGAGMQQSWAAALDHAQRAAELGLRLAQAELAALSGQWPLALDILDGKEASESPWSQCRSSIDVAKWLEPPRVSMVSKAPRIAAVKDLAPTEACDWLVARARARMRPARIYDEKAGEHVVASGRTNSSFPFLGPDRDLILAVLRARISSVSGMQVRAMESPHVLHYAVGQEFLPHFDSPENPDAVGFPKRALTCLLSLNDDYDGGETTFPAINGRWRGRKGGALFFWNLGSDGALDRRTLHAGTPVTRGEKWMLSQWIDQTAEG